MMYGLISTSPVSPPPVVGSNASYSGSVAALCGPSVIPLTAAVVGSGFPLASTSTNEPVCEKPPLPDGSVAVTGVSVTVPTNAPAGMPVPVTLLPSSVRLIELSSIVVASIAAVAPLSVRPCDVALPPPR